MEVLIAFDKFKDAMSAREACQTAADALSELGITAEMAPITDGGEGFATILTEAVGGEVLTVDSVNPYGEPRKSQIGLVSTRETSAKMLSWLDLPKSVSTIGIIEMAQGSGLEQLPAERRNPWLTSTRGTGLEIQAAMEHGAKAILIGIGGSATNDLGTGLLQGLGLEFLDHQGEAIERICPAEWSRVEEVTGPISLPPLRIACDVDNPLLGHRGAAAVYGPQKGLRQEDLPKMESQMLHMGKLLATQFGRDFQEGAQEPGSGAAGGIGFGLRLSGSDVTFLPGFDLVSQWLRLPTRVREADVVLTGEGRFDASSLSGKGPGTLLSVALEAGTEIFVFAGVITPEARQQRPSGLPDEHLIAITPEGYDLPRALEEAPSLLRKAVRVQFRERTADPA